MTGDRRRALTRGKEHYTRAKNRVEETAAGRLWQRLNALDYMNHALVFAALLLLAFFPFIIVVSALADRSVASGLATHIGLNRQATRVFSHLFASSASTSAALTAGSLTTLIFGALAVGSALRSLYEHVFGLESQGMRGVHRLFAWVGAICLASFGLGVLGKPVRNSGGGAFLLGPFSFAIATVFFWWSMHFLLGGRMPWRKLLPSAVATAVCWLGLGVFSSFYFSSSVITNNHEYGAIGVVFTLMSWLIAIGVVIILGAVVGVVWNEWRSDRGARRASHAPNRVRLNGGIGGTTDVADSPPIRGG